MNTQYRPLTPAELYALEQAAHRERAEALAQLFKAGGRWIRQAYAALAERAQGIAGKAVRHA